ncbi:MAG: hypothetical protein J6T10_22535 [Methanobrevibacter sp.]|nr:hypothetical protein [Methanobrevibacter sp.]
MKDKILFIINEWFKYFLNGVRKNIEYIIISFITLINCLLYCTRSLNEIQFVGLNVAITFIVIMLFKLKNDIEEYEIKKRLKDQNKIPFLNKRFTQKTKDYIYIEKNDWSKAVLYMAEIEDYLENIGIYE